MASTKKCPDCAEIVQAEARVCRYCGHPFTGGAAREKARKARGRRQAASCCGCSCGGILALLVVAIMLVAVGTSLAGAWAVVVAAGISIAAVGAVTYAVGGRPRWAVSAPATAPRKP